MTVFALANRYRVIQEMSSGLPFSTYKAKDITLDKIVLINKVCLKLPKNSGISHLFETEKLTGLEHPNILNINDIFEEDNVQYIVMDFIEGLNLNTYLQDQSVKVDLVLDIVTQINEALIYAKTKGINYNNLKLENIIITDNSVVKLTGFEITDNNLLFDSANDKNSIYSLGLILYEIFTAKAPSSIEDYFTCSLEDLKIINNLIPEEICKVIVKALHSDISKRYQTIEDLNLAIGIARLKLNSHGFSNLSLTGTNIPYSKLSSPPLLKDIIKNDNIDNYNHFANFELKKIITDLVSQKSTGVLKVVSGDNQSLLYIRDGEFFHAKYNKKNIFSIDIFYETLCWENGSYIFEEDVTTEKYSFDSIPSDLLLMDSMKCIEDYKFCSKKYNKALIPLVINLSENISPKLTEVLNLIDNERTISEIIILSNMDVSSTLSGIDELVLNDIIKFK